MRIGIIIQARMGSQRLPGKTLALVQGKALLAYLCERMARCALADMVAVATSSEAADDAIVSFCGGMGVPCYRGSHVDVAARFRDTAAALGLDGFVRVCGDSPFLDPALVDHAIGLFRQGGSNLVTNVHPRTFPMGQSVEVVDAVVFARAYDRMRLPDEFEHVTRHFYDHATEYRLLSFTSGRGAGDLCLCVDEADDLARVAGLVERMERPHWDYGWEELAAMIGTDAGEVA